MRREKAEWARSLRVGKRVGAYLWLAGSPLQVRRAIPEAHRQACSRSLRASDWERIERLAPKGTGRGSHVVPLCESFSQSHR